MDNYKNKIIQLINSNAIVNDDLYKDIYFSLIKNIKTNNTILENNIVDKYDEMRNLYFA